MTQFILDTDHLTLLQQGNPRLLQRVESIPPTFLALTIITVEEQLRGWLDAVRRHHGSARQIWAYRGLQEAIEFFPRVAILPFEQAALQQFEALRRQRIRIGAQDLRIAAIALAAGATLVTRNGRDFSQVPGLALEDWSA